MSRQKGESTRRHGSSNGDMDIVALNQPYLGQPGFREVFHAAGHRSISVGWHPGECDIVTPQPTVTLGELWELLPLDFVPERIVYFDRSEPVRVIGLESSDIPTVVHLVDSHIHHDWHPLWSGCFDAALIAMRGYANLFSRNPDVPPVDWLPLWAARLGASPEAPRSTTVSFRGSMGATHPKRRTFFEGVKTRVAGDFGQGPFFDVYNDSKIILNDCLNADLNWRVFEALASGAMLLTPRVSAETVELFPEGECLVTYRPHEVDDAVRQIDYYLTHEEERRAIAAAGYERVRSHHLAINRAQALLRVVEGVKPRPREGKAFCAAGTYLRLSAVFETFQKVTYLKAAQAAADRLINAPGLSLDWVHEKAAILNQLARDAAGRSNRRPPQKM